MELDKRYLADRIDTDLVKTIWIGEMKKLRGFSLIELMVVVVVIGILASIALPAYRDYVMQAKLTEAFGELVNLRTQMEKHLFNKQRYETAVGSGICGAVMPTKDNFTYTCEIRTVTNTADGYLLKAVGKATVGLDGFEYRINEQGLQMTQSVASGWSMTSTCWTKKRSGAC